MKVKKFTLTKSENVISTYKSPDYFVNDIYYPQEAKTMSVYLIEIKTESNPSDIIFQLGLKDRLKVIPVSLHKTTLFYINNIYCWNTPRDGEFIFDLDNFKIQIDGGVDDFEIDFYYSTDQKIPLILFENKQYPHFS